MKRKKKYCPTIAEMNLEQTLKQYAITAGIESGDLEEADLSYDESEGLFESALTSCCESRSDSDAHNFYSEKKDILLQFIREMPFVLINTAQIESRIHRLLDGDYDELIDSKLPAPDLRKTFISADDAREMILEVAQDIANARENLKSWQDVAIQVIRSCPNEIYFQSAIYLEMQKLIAGDYSKALSEMLK